MLDLTRTATALAAFETWDSQAWAVIRANPNVTNGDVYAYSLERERQARKVGHAFGLDTADRNSLSTCEACVRPWDPWLRSLLAKFCSNESLAA